MGGPEQRRAWPEVEQRAAEKVDAALDRLAGLDAVEAAPGYDVFRRTLALELDDDLGRVGRLGDGILMGHVSLGLGLDLDRVFVCGLAEGTFPRPGPRRLAPPRCRPSRDRRRAPRCGRLASTPTTPACSPRWPPRATSASSCSRAATSGAPPSACRRGSCSTPSRPSGASGCTPTTSRELARRLVRSGALVRGRHVTGRVPRDRPGVPPPRAARALPRGRARRVHELATDDPALAHGLDCATSRASSRFTRFDGNLRAVAVPSPAAPGVAVSATRLETWARSPHDYLMQQVLGVEIAELPEEVYELSALDRGSLVHETLDEFLREVLARPGGAPAPSVAWTGTDRARLRELAELRFTAATRRRGSPGGACSGTTCAGGSSPTSIASSPRTTPCAGNSGCGRWPPSCGSGSPTPPTAVAIMLSDGRVLRFRGAADRVDRTDDGALWVIDYKTGRATSLDPDDPTAGGTRLQLPVYAHAARAAFGQEDTAVGAAYWFVSTRGEFRWSELELTGSVEARVDEVLRAITDGIEHGVFPCRVDPPDTRPRRWRTFDDPDMLGTRDRYREWERKRGAPEVAAYVALRPRPAPESSAS